MSASMRLNENGGADSPVKMCSTASLSASLNGAATTLENTRTSTNPRSVMRIPAISSMSQRSALSRPPTHPVTSFQLSGKRDQTAPPRSS